MDFQLGTVWEVFGKYLGAIWELFGNYLLIKHSCFLYWRPRRGAGRFADPLVRWLVDRLAGKLNG